VFAPCCCTKGGGPHYSHGRRTRYRMATIPVLLDAFASQDWRTKCMLDLSLNGVITASFDPRFLPVHYKNGGRVGPFPLLAGLLRGHRSPLLFRSGPRPVPCVCAKLVIPCHRLPWFPVVIRLHREDVDLCTSCLFFPGSLPAVSLSPDPVRSTEDPLFARHLHPLAPISTLTRDPSSPT